MTSRWAAPVGFVLATVLSGPRVVPVHEEPAHRPVFVNSEVRVLEVVIAPRATTLFHTHTHDQIGLTIAPGPTRFQLLGEEPAPDDPADHAGDLEFETFPKPMTHRGTNLGETPIHYLVLELLGRAPIRPASLPPAAGPVLLENRRARVSRVRLEPGASAPPHAHAAGFVLGSMSDGLLAGDGLGASPRHFAPGFVLWSGPVGQHAFRNAGDEPIDLLEFEILP